LVTAFKHINNIRAIARQPPITTTEELLKAVFSAGFAPGLYNEDPRQDQKIESSVAGFSLGRKDLSERN
jgi:hypothetical protein